ncbi:hypothetical protein Tco_0809974 [Tanacetum coccineum]
MMSTAEAEYVSLSACCAQVIWMRTQLLDYGYKYNRIPMYCDSKSAIAIMHCQHSKTKHITSCNHYGTTTTCFDVHPGQIIPKTNDMISWMQTSKVILNMCNAHPKANMTNIIKNLSILIQFCCTSFVPLIYMAQFWNTLKEDGSKYRLMFMLDKKELSLTLDDFRTIFHLPQANADNHDSFVTPPSFLDMVPFFKQQLGFTMELKTSSSFKTN